MELIKPKFENNNIPIIFGVDGNFVPYLGVTIKSIIDNTSANNNYDMVILNTDINKYDQKRIKSMEQDNVSIRFYDMNELMNKYSEYWCADGQYTLSIFYRFFIPQLFKDFGKILYLDADLVLNCDAKELYSIDLGENVIGACADVPRQLEGDFYEKFIMQTLKIKTNQYFNAGMFVLDITKIDENTFLKQCVMALSDLNYPTFNDQDVLNYLFKDKVKYLDNSYNLSWNCLHHWTDSEEKLPSETFTAYQRALENPKIVHYAGGMKPWKNPELYLSEYFWKYARQTVFYEEIIYKNIQSLSCDKRKKGFSFTSIFSIDGGKNKRHTVITILGIKLKIKKGKNA